MARKKRQRRRNGLIEGLNAILTLLVIVIILAAGVAIYGVQRFYADGPGAEDTTFNVPRGASLSTIAESLTDQGLVADPWTFRIGTLLNRKQADLKAGEFRITAHASMAEILKEITEGKAVTYNVTIPEGWTSWEAVQRINAAANLTGEITEVPPEGTLLPNTYSFERDQDRQIILDQMEKAMADDLAEVWASRDPDLPLASPEELLTLASIVEKETGIASERPMVAAVFINRLKKGMRLQSDPTIIYGITQGQGPLGRGLTRSEIDKETPYNTYQIDGLPPGPICNPGIDALKAVANPAESDAIYFVAAGATPDQGHVFATTLDEHNRNVAAYRRAVAEYEAEQEAAAAAAEQADQPNADAAANEAAPEN
ncbi:MAG: endolytic transglycosylase MltG [Hyphomicrobiaceae bacterium]|nr:endolytic transglycosylase MltG [Hyphomicrobiaceae bacterium]MCC0024684.1 endolytic transglycosylase MltG [Hyphomicrobiaceae bacterium]